MKTKNLFYLLATMILAASIFVSCEPTPEPDPEPDTDGTDSVVVEPVYDLDNLYLYGNCEDDGNNANALGMTGGEYTYGAASKLNGGVLASKGNKILGLRFYVGDDGHDTEVFVGEDLNNPAYRQPFTYSKENGWQYVLFDTPYEITGSDLYVGYTITGEGFLLGMENTKQAYDSEMLQWNGKWGTLNGNTGGSMKGRWSIQAILAGGDYSAETQYQVALDALELPASARAGENVLIRFNLRNKGVRSFSRADVVCTVAGKSTTVTVDKVLFGGQAASVEVEAMIPVGIEGTTDIAVSASVSGKENEPFVVSGSLNVYAGLRRNAILIEQFTGQGCPNCPTGHAAIEKSISELADPSRVIWVAHHTYIAGDELTIDGELAVSQALAVTAYPMCNINRTPVKYDPNGRAELTWHPGYMTGSILNSLIPMPADATIVLDRTFDPSTRELKVTVSGKSLKPDAYITVLVNQDKMVARQAGGGENYQHTAPRAYLTKSTFGDKLELDAEGGYKVEYTYTIPEKVGRFDCVLEDMEVVAFVHGDIKDKAARAVYNADKKDILGK